MTMTIAEEGAFLIDGKPYVLTHDAARETGISSDHIGRLAKAGRFPSHRFGSVWFVDRDACLAYWRLRSQH